MSAVSYYVFVTPLSQIFFLLIADMVAYDTFAVFLQGKA